MPPPAATLLLPPRERLAGAPLPPALAAAIGRADRLPAASPGAQAQLGRHFDVLPRGWPVAALTRALDADDAGGPAWLRADPAYVRPDINGARLLGIGAALGVDADDTAAFLPALRPLFGDAGFLLDAPRPDRWYLRLPREARLPAFADPADALGDDLFDHLPGAGGDAAPEARRWRALLSEVQVVLHNHPRNAARMAGGRVPVNSLWFWGAGVLPDRVATSHHIVASDDPLLRALAVRAGAQPAALPGGFPGDTGAMGGKGTPGDALYDLRDLRDAGALLAGWLAPAAAAAANGTVSRLLLDFADGARLALARGHRWRAWRRAARALDA